MVEPELVQDCGQPVVVVDDAVDRVVRKLVGLSVDVSSPEATTGHPLAETVGVVVAADLVAFGQPLSKLDHRQSAHLAAPVHDCAVEQTALF